MMLIWIGLAILGVEVLGVMGFAVWANRRTTGRARCTCCGSVRKICCTDYGMWQPKNPRCDDCCDHTHSYKERE